MCHDTIDRPEIKSPITDFYRTISKFIKIEVCKNSAVWAARQREFTVAGSYTKKMVMITNQPGQVAMIRAVERVYLKLKDSFFKIFVGKFLHIANISLLNTVTHPSPALYAFSKIPLKIDDSKRTKWLSARYILMLPEIPDEM